MPSKNIWLTDSVYPTSHRIPAQTGTSPIAGPLASQHLTTWDVKTIATTFISNPTMKRIGQDRIIFVSSVNGIAKVLATGEAFEQLSFLESRANRGQPLSSLLHARIPLLEGRPKFLVQCFGSHL